MLGIIASRQSWLAACAACSFAASRALIQEWLPIHYQVR
jgi:hypothetical protein